MMTSRSLTLLFATLLLAGLCQCRSIRKVQDDKRPVGSGPADTGKRDSGTGDSAPGTENCIDDDREEDDTRAKAMANGTLYSPTGSMTFRDRMACKADDDFYYAHADCCNQAGTLVTWDPADGQLDVAFLDQSGSPIALEASDVAERKPGSVRLLKAKHGGDFYVRIRSVKSNAVPYTVQIFAQVFL